MRHPEKEFIPARFNICERVTVNLAYSACAAQSASLPLVVADDMDDGIGVEEDDLEEDNLEARNEAERWIITLAEPPRGTPRDNRELADVNLPTMRTAVRRWEDALGTSFTWAAMQ
jgi:hypothetical protein